VTGGISGSGGWDKDNSDNKREMKKRNEKEMKKAMAQQWLIIT